MIRCEVASGTGSAAPCLHDWFSAWAGTAGVALVPGTLNLRPLEPLRLPPGGISLRPWDDRLPIPSWKTQPGYHPRLYPGELLGTPVWVFVWFEEPDDWRDNFALELVSSLHLRTAHGLRDGARVTLEIHQTGG